MSEGAGQHDNQDQQRRPPRGLEMGNNQQDQLQDNHLTLQLQQPVGPVPKVEQDKKDAAGQSQVPERLPLCLGQGEQEAAADPGHANQVGTPQADVDPSLARKRARRRREEALQHRHLFTTMGSGHIAGDHQSIFRIRAARATLNRAQNRTLRPRSGKPYSLVVAGVQQVFVIPNPRHLVHAQVSPNQKVKPMRTVDLNLDMVALTRCT